MVTLPYSWQECRLCGGAYLLWADPAAHLDSDETGIGERWTEWVHLDGRQYDQDDSAACNTCDALDLESMASPQRRWGLSLPGATLAVMRRKGLPIPAAPIRAGHAPVLFGTAPAATLAGPGADARPVPAMPFLAPAPVQDPAFPSPVAAPAPTPESLPGDRRRSRGPSSSRAIPFLASLTRSISAAPRVTVETYAPRDPLELRDPLVWLVTGIAAVTLVAVVVGWFTSPGNVPQ